MVEKLKIVDERQNTFGNDIGSIMFQLKKMRINDIPDIYIYFEKVCEQNIETFNKAGLL